MTQSYYSSLSKAYSSMPSLEVFMDFYYPTNSSYSVGPSYLGGTSEDPYSWSTVIPGTTQLYH